MPTLLLLSQRHFLPSSSWPSPTLRYRPGPKGQPKVSAHHASNISHALQRRRANPSGRSRPVARALRRSPTAGSPNAARRPPARSRVSPNLLFSLPIGGPVRRYQGRRRHEVGEVLVLLLHYLPRPWNPVRPQRCQGASLLLVSS